MDNLSNSYSNPTPKKTTNGKRFGIEQPVPRSPGRPKLPPGVKERRAFLRAKIQEATPKAIEVLMDALNADEQRDRIRAAEILVNHSLPHQEEVEVSDDRPLPALSDEQVKFQLAAIRASRNGRSSGNGSAPGNGVAS